MSHKINAFISKYFLCAFFFAMFCTMPQLAKYVSTDGARFFLLFLMFVFELSTICALIYAKRS